MSKTKEIQEQINAKGRLLLEKQSELMTLNAEIQTLQNEHKKLEEFESERRRNGKVACEMLEELGYSYVTSGDSTYYGFWQKGKVRAKLSRTGIEFWLSNSIHRVFHYEHVARATTIRNACQQMESEANNMIEAVLVIHREYPITCLPSEIGSILTEDVCGQRFAIQIEQAKRQQKHSVSITIKEPDQKEAS